MFGKAAVLLVCLTLARTDTIGRYFTPASIASSALSKFVPNPKARATPAPIYETEDTNREIAASRANEEGLFTPFDRAATISEKYDLRNINGAPYSPSVGRPISYYPTHSSFIPDSESGPVTYTTHTQSRPLVENTYSTPLNINTVSLGYNSEAEIVQNIGSKTKVVYDAPSVSYVSVNRPGASYSW